MTTLNITVPQINQPNATQDPIIATDLSNLSTWAAGNIDGVNVSATLTGRRLIGQATTTIAGFSGGDYSFGPGGQTYPSGTVENFAPMWWYLDPANYAVTGKSNTQLIVRMSVATNTSAPAVTFVGKLCAVTFGGGAGQISATLGAVQGSASVATPAASTVSVAESSAFAFPTAGAYAAFLNLSGAVSGASATGIMFQLFVLNS